MSDAVGSAAALDEPTVSGGGVEEETFGRVVAPGNSLGQSEFSGNPNWVDAGQTNGGASVDGSAAIGTSGAFPQVGPDQKINDFNLALPAVMTSRVQWSYNPLSAGPNEQLRWYIESMTFPRWNMSIGVNAIAAPYAAISELVVGAYDADHDTGYDGGLLNFTQVPDIWWWVKASFESLRVKAKIWQDGTTEPDWMMSVPVPATIAAALNGANRLHIVNALTVGGGSPFGGNHSRWDSIRFEGSGSQPDDTLSGGPIGTGYGR